MRRKDPEKEEAILKAAIEAFAEQGYHATKMSAIADKAGVAAGSLYLYFSNKESIIRRIIDEAWKRMYSDYEKIANRPDFTAVEKLDALIDTVFDLFMGDPKKAIIFVNEQHHLMQAGFSDFIDAEERFIQLGQRALDEGREANLFNPHIDMKIFKEFVFGGLRHLLNLWAHQPEEYSPNIICQEVKLIIKKGILN